MTAGANQYYTGESPAQLRVALSEDIPSLFQGGGNSANPTALVGTAVVNGTAHTYMRSDAAPRIDVTMIVTWTGLHTFNAGVVIGPLASGPSLTVTGAPNQRALTVQASATAGQSFGLNMNAGTNATDQTFVIRNAANTLQYALMSGDGKLTINGNVSVNGNAPPAQVAGWGTPTGAAVVANFPGAGPATLAQCSTAIAELIAVLKAFGLLAA